jgi:hypothetical protein
MKKLTELMMHIISTIYLYLIVYPIYFIWKALDSIKYKTQLKWVEVKQWIQKY